MATFDEILDRAASARYSNAAPWRRHTGAEVSLGSIPMPSGGGQDWRATLGISDPVQEDLQTARQRYDTLKAQADALGEDGGGAMGLLSALGRTLDIPRAAVFALGKEVVEGIAPGGEEGTLSGMRESFNERLGFGDIGPLQFEEDDNPIERGLKAVGAFAGDVATDPLTYLTFGSGALGNKAMSGVVKSTVATRAGKLLDPETLSTWASKALRSRAAEQVGKSVDDLSDEMIESLDLLKKADQSLEGATSQIGSAAAEAYLREGAGGVRRFLRDEFGDTGEALFKDLPADVRGGIRVRVPFAYDAEGARSTIPLLGGGGRLQEALGITGVTRFNRRAINRLRSGRAAQTLSATLGGAHGDLYGKMLADIIRKDPDDLTRFSYHQYDSVVRAFAKARRSADEMSELTRETLGMAHYYIDSTPGANGPKLARQSFEHYMQDPAKVRELSIAKGLYLDEAGKFHLTDDIMEPGSAVMPEHEVRGLAAAMLAHDTLRHLAHRAREAGVTMGDIEDYVPRAITDAAREAKRLKKAGRRPKTGRGGGAYDPTTSRKFFIEPELYEDEAGEIALRWRHLTPDEANARVKAVSPDADVEDLFETDPFMMLAKYTDGLASVVYRTNFAKLLHGTGNLVQAGTVGRSLYSATDVKHLMTKDVEPAFEALKQVDETVEQAVREREDLLRVVGAIGQVKSMETKATLTGILANGLRDVAEGLDDFTGLTKADAKKIKAARAKLRRAAGKADNARIQQVQVDELGEALGKIGLDKVGGGPHLRALPPELDETFAPEMMRIATEKFYKARNADSALQEWIDRTYRPYLSIFKTMATVGRGIGFHVRNLLGGGLWNNYLIDVRPADSALSAKIVKARIQAGIKARREAAEEMAKLRGITLHQAQHEISPTAVQARIEVILRDELSKIEFAHGKTLYDVHRLSTDNAVDWRQGEPSELSESMRRVEELGEGATARERARAASGQVLFPGDDPSIPQRLANSLIGGRHPAGWWVRANGNIAQRSESFMRLAAFITGLRRYGFDDGGEMAALLPKATQFDYHDLSEIERKWLRGFAIPFYTWQRNNIPLQFRALIHEPGKMNRLLHAVDNAEDHFADDDQDLIPEWMRERMGFMTRFAFDGSPLIVGAEAPATALNEYFKIGDRPSDTLAGFGHEVVSALSPVIQVPIEFSTGTDFFTGSKVLPEDRTANAIDAALPWVAQARKIAGIAGAGDAERQARTASELIRQLAPVAAVSTLTPRQELGALYGEMDRLQEVISRHPEDAERVRFYLSLGLTPDQVASLLD